MTEGDALHTGVAVCSTGQRKDSLVKFQRLVAGDSDVSTS